MKRAGVNLADVIDPVDALTVNSSLRAVNTLDSAQRPHCRDNLRWAAGRDPGSEGIGGLSVKQQ
jgi:hypothetical protein